MQESWDILGEIHDGYRARIKLKCRFCKRECSPYLFNYKHKPILNCRCWRPYLKNKKFGKLTAIRFEKFAMSNDSYNSFWLFRCDCGQEKIIDSYKVAHKNGLTHCGCVPKKPKKPIQRKIKKICGQRFNKLTAINFVSFDGKKQLWSFHCDCGNVITVSAYNVIRGHRKSCGCLRIEQWNEIKQYRKNLATKYFFRRKLYAFLKPSKIKKIRKCNKKTQRGVVISKLKMFLSKTNKRRDRVQRKEISKEFLNAVLDKIKLNPNCYLTGKSIDFSDSFSYNFDHIVPRSKGGNNSIENLGICSRQANMSKSDNTVDEHLDYCKRVLTNFGYEITKRIEE